MTDICDACAFEDACPSAHFNKTDHDFDRRFQMEDEGLIYQDDKVFRWSMLDEEMNYRWF